MHLAKTCALALTLAALVAGAASAQTTTINFDDFVFASGTANAAANRYQGSGAVFGAPVPVENVLVAEGAANSATFLTLGGTAPNGVALGTTLVSLSFVLPGTSTPGVTNSVQALFFDTEVDSLLGTLQAFDANNVLLGTATMTTPAAQGAVLGITAPGIARVTFVTDSDGAVFDNVTFPTPVPEPSSLALLLLAGAGLGAAVVGRRRMVRRRQPFPAGA